MQQQAKAVNKLAPKLRLKMEREISVRHECWVFFLYLFYQIATFLLLMLCPIQLFA